MFYLYANIGSSSSTEKKLHISKLGNILIFIKSVLKLLVILAISLALGGAIYSQIAYFLL